MNRAMSCKQFETHINNEPLTEILEKNHHIFSCRIIFINISIHIENMQLSLGMCTSNISIRDSSLISASSWDIGQSIVYDLRS